MQGTNAARGGRTGTMRGPVSHRLARRFEAADDSGRFVAHTSVTRKCTRIGSLTSCPSLARDPVFASSSDSDVALGKKCPRPAIAFMCYPAHGR